MSLLKDRITCMVHAFGDHERKDAVRALARDVGAMEARVAELEARCRRLDEAGDALERDKQTFKKTLADLGVVGSMGFGSTVKWAQAKEAKP